MKKRFKVIIIGVLAGVLLALSALVFSACTEKTFFTVEYAATEGGSIEGQAVQQVGFGKDSKTVTAIANANEGYVFIMWSDGKTEPTRKESNITENFFVRAIFEIPHDVTVRYTVEEGGRIEGEATQTLPVWGCAKTVTAVADEGYIFTGWSDGLKTAERTDDYISGNREYTAEFERKIYSVSYKAGEGGTVQGQTEQQIAFQDTAKTVTAIPAPSYVFAGWSDGVTTAERTDKVKGALNVTAEFELIKLKVELTASDGGSLSGEAVQTVEYGNSGIPVTAVPNEGYKFIGWSDGYSGTIRYRIPPSVRIAFQIPC